MGTRSSRLQALAVGGGGLIFITLAGLTLFGRSVTLGHLLTALAGVAGLAVGSVAIGWTTSRGLRAASHIKGKLDRQRVHRAVAQLETHERERVGGALSLSAGEDADEGGGLSLPARQQGQLSETGAEAPGADHE